MEDAVRWLEACGKRVVGLLGHSKGGTNVILYGARHDACGLRYVNICGRCWCAMMLQVSPLRRQTLASIALLEAQALVEVLDRRLRDGMNHRFDDETLARLDKEGELEVPHPKTGKPYILTKAVRCSWQSSSLHAHMTGRH